METFRQQISFLLLNVIIVAHISFGQSIRGKIIDETSKEPIYLANIFLANTTIGTTSNQDGFFEIKRIPFGSYELVISMMGYEFQKIILQIQDTKEKNFQIKLKSKVLQGEKVTVSAEIPEEWLRNLKIFKKILFGIKDIAKECDIKNPEIINFDYVRTSGRFRAFTEYPVTLINNALGYEITFYINKFEANLFDDDIYVVEQVQDQVQRFKKGALEYSGSIGFREIPAQNMKQTKKWQANRLIAYKGSRRHFLQALSENRLKKEGFQICGTTGFHPKHENNVKIEKILQKGQNSKFILTFPNYLKVRYKKEKDEVKYKIRMSFLENANLDFDQFEKQEWKIGAECAYQDSWIKIAKGNSVIFDKNGKIEPGSAVLEVAHGYWLWDSFAELLPFNYVPIV